MDLAPALDAIDRALITDPQTSGGLLVSCDPAALGAVLDVFERHHFTEARAIGTIGARQDGAFLTVA